jgi:hypothetical protein
MVCVLFIFIFFLNNDNNKETEGKKDLMTGSKMMNWKHGRRRENKKGKEEGRKTKEMDNKLLVSIEEEKKGKQNYK